MKAQIVTFGELLIRLCPPGHKRIIQANHFEIHYGGSEANVAVSLANFNLPVKYISRLPENDLGRSAASVLNKYKVDTSEIIWGGNRIGIYFLETGASERGSKVIYDRANSAMSEIKKGMIDWGKIFSDASWFHWSGITPAISQDAAEVCAEAIKAANKKGITVSADLNYRKNLWKYGKEANEIMPQLVEGCDVIIGGEEDTTKVLGIENSIASGVSETCRLWNKRFPKAKNIFISQRTIINASHQKYGAVSFDGKKLFTAPARDVTHIVDRVGTGDALTAGIIYGLLTFPDDQEKILNFAIAAAALKHTIPGDFNLATTQEAEDLMNNKNSSEIKR